MKLKQVVAGSLLGVTIAISGSAFAGPYGDQLLTWMAHERAKAAAAANPAPAVAASCQQQAATGGDKQQPQSASKAEGSSK